MNCIVSLRMEEKKQSANRSFEPAPNRPPNSDYPQEAGIRLSLSVDRAFKNLPDTPYPALAFAYEILKFHSDYVSSLYINTFADLKNRWEIVVLKTNEKKQEG